MFPYRRLLVWQRAHRLAVDTYRVTEGRSFRRLPELASQLRRAMASVPANISEGSGHESQAQFNRFLGIALASAREADYHLLLSRDLGVIDEVNYADFLSRLGEVQAMLCGLRRRVREQR